MSTFNGEISGIAGISVDHFENSEQKCYFLSHCHSDHMKGLLTLQTKAPIYATPISALIIRRRCPHLEENVRTLENGVLNSIELNEDGSSTTFNVTALSAGHCAGACQLLFQIEGCDILYTGDFRMSLKHVKNIKQFDEIKNHENLSVYLDSTFMKTSFAMFPTQTDSVRKIIEIADAHLKKARNPKVILKVPARYGYEYVLTEINRKLGEKICIIEPELYEQYSLISELDSCVTNNQKSAKIHLRQTYITDSIDFKKTDTVLTIHLSAMYWLNWTGGSFVEKTSDNSYRVCFATHNSLNEIRDFLVYLKPKNVYLNVVPSNSSERNEMMKVLSDIQRQYRVDDVKPVEEAVVMKRFSFKRIRSLTSQKVSSKAKKQKI